MFVVQGSFAHDVLWHDMVCHAIPPATSQGQFASVSDDYTDRQVFATSCRYKYDA